MSHKNAIAVFVKTPNLSPFKTRLAARIGRAGADEFYRLSLRAIEETLSESPASPYWAIGEREGLEHPLWKNLSRIHTGDGCLGARQHHVYTHLLEGHDRALLIGADAPQLSSAIIAEAITALNTHDFVVGPAHDGGYYLFGGRVSVPKNIWMSVEYSADTTRIDLINKLPTEPFMLRALTDVDTQDDLQYIAQEMPTPITQTQIDLMKWIKTL